MYLVGVLQVLGFSIAQSADFNPGTELKSMDPSSDKLE
jgi:hypothetical protein